MSETVRVHDLCTHAAHCMMHLHELDTADLSTTFCDTFDRKKRRASPLFVSTLLRARDVVVAIVVVVEGLFPPATTGAWVQETPRDTSTNCSKNPEVVDKQRVI